MGEIKNTQGAPAEADRALAGGDAALASSSLRDGDPSRVCSYPALYDSGNCCGGACGPQNVSSRSMHDEIEFDTCGRLSRRKLATAVHYFMAQFRQSHFGEDHGTPAVIYGPTAAMPRGCWFDEESRRFLDALAPAQAIKARQGGDAEGGSVEDKSAVAAGDVPQGLPDPSAPGEVERLVDAFGDAAIQVGYEKAMGGDAEEQRALREFVDRRTALLSHISMAARGEGASRSPQVSGIYTASKTKHADRWKSLRAEGWPINSTWIDEAGVGETACFTNLWERCICEASQADAVLLYREPGDVLKGALVEAGAALSQGVPVYAVGCEEFSFSKAAGWVNCRSVEIALEAIRKQLATPLTITIAASPVSGPDALSAATNPQDQE